MDGTSLVRKTVSILKLTYFERSTEIKMWLDFGVLLHNRALTSGTGVALALLIGAAGPLIGVAISASLLPPVVNCVSIHLYFREFRSIWLLVIPRTRREHHKMSACQLKSYNFRWSCNKFGIQFLSACENYAFCKINSENENGWFLSVLIKCTIS